ncbi:MAG: amidohydrolase family protein [Dehalococcoidia bacterium]
MTTYPTPDLIIRNGTVYDGTGAPGRRADVAVTNGRITAIGDAASQAPREIDATGLAITPGFIDVHTHDDIAVLVEPEMAFKVMQGVTTVVTGNCGSGVIPFEPAALHFAARHPGAELRPWQDFAGYLHCIDETAPSLNVAALVGHGTLRLGAVTDQERPATSSELDVMRGRLRDALDAGAVGLSTGLTYHPGRSVQTAEIIEVARALRDYPGALYASHIRNEGPRFIEALEEAVAIAETAGVPLQVSHLKALGRENWDKIYAAIELLDAARARGVAATWDQYPYTASSTSLKPVLESGRLDNFDPSEVLIAAAPEHPAWDGLSIEAINRDWGLAPKQAAERILAEAGPYTTIILFVIAEDGIEAVMKHPATMIGSDGIPSPGKPHPRLYGTFAHVLGEYVRDRRVLELPAAVHRMTGLPAAKFQLTGRGVLEPGAHADLVVFDPARIADVATYNEPRQHPAGIRDVFVNGMAVVRDGAHTSARPGKALRRGVD